MDNMVRRLMGYSVLSDKPAQMNDDMLQKECMRRCCGAP